MVKKCTLLHSMGLTDGFSDEENRLKKFIATFLELIHRLLFQERFNINCEMVKRKTDSEVTKKADKQCIKYAKSATNIKEHFINICSC